MLAFILSIIRQESEFDLRANSHAGAKGLNAIDALHCKVVAKQANLPYSKSRLTRDAEYNINLGSHYIAGLILEYDGAYPFAIAAYNAGPRVRYWKKINKNRKKQINYVDWIELIKFKETRNYVQRVLENYNVYRYILEQKPVSMKNFFKDAPLILKLAEEEGFEPSVQVFSHEYLANDWFKPLTHFPGNLSLLIVLNNQYL